MISQSLPSKRTPNVHHPDEGGDGLQKSRTSPFATLLESLCLPPSVLRARAEARTD